jgi:hypothetical protein
MLRNSSSRGIRNWRLKVGVTAMRRRVARGAALAERRGLQRREAGAHVREVGRAVGCQAEIAAAEELEADVRFELADAVADCAGRDAQFVGCAARVPQRATASKVSRHWIGGMCCRAMGFYCTIALLRGLAFGCSGRVHRPPGTPLRECPPLRLLLYFAAGSTRCPAHLEGAAVEQLINDHCA